jgi:hypothetical protein
MEVPQLVRESFPSFGLREVRRHGRHGERIRREAPGLAASCYGTVPQAFTASTLYQ